jgi:predicted nucleic acid-binding protein
VSVAFIDSNVLAYFYDSDTPDKQAIAQALMASTVAAKQAVISTQVLQESYWTITRKLARRLDAARAERAVHIFARLPTIQVGVPIILAATARVGTTSIAFWDALVVESALVAGATRLLTEDLQHGQVFDGRLRVENPFLPADPRSPT